MSKLRSVWQAIRRDNRFLLITVSVAFVLIVLIIAATMYIINSFRTASIDVLVAPESARVIINGKEYSNGTYKIEPGNFTVTITKDGFNGYQESFSLSAGQTKDLAVYLTQTDGGYDWYLNHPSDDLIMTRIGDKQASDKSAEMLAKYPILSVLPHRDDDGSYDYTINPKFSGDTLKSLVIELNSCSDYSKPIYKAEALKWLSDQGYNPNDYAIEITDACSH